MRRSSRRDATMSSELPTVAEVLTLDSDGIGPLTSPVLLVGLTGWFDVAGVGHDGAGPGRSLGHRR